MSESLPQVVPLGLKRDGDGLLIEWSDGETHRLTWRLLREQCPCAVCCARRAKPAPDPSALPVLTAAEARPVEPTAVTPMGNYAYGIAFNDGHNSGIYTFDYLRMLGAGV